MQLYRDVGKQLTVPVKIAFYVYNEGGMRQELGFRSGEFNDRGAYIIGENYEAGISLMDECRGYNHLFTIFQRAPNYCKLILEARRRGERVAIAAESPCNMFSGLMWIAKEFYNRFYIPRVYKEVIGCCDFFINYSGDNLGAAKLVGWSPSKIAPFGYFPPPLEGSKCCERIKNKPYTILCSGVLTKYRGADVLVEALRILKRAGVQYEAIITQEGELLPALKRKAKKYSLPIKFLGFLQMDELIRLYENCSVYVGAGKSEPWGMRLNDALNCGAPLVISRGMGGVQLVDRYKCGLSFKAGDASGLASCLMRLHDDIELYKECAHNAIVARKMCSPFVKAQEMIDIMNRYWRD